MGNKLVFASARETRRVVKKIFKWEDKFFEDLYFSVLKLDGNLESPTLFEKEINSTNQL